MKYAIVNGVKTNIRDVEKGTIGFDCWYRDYQVKACKGHYMQYWKYVDQKPALPEGYENETDWHECWKKLVKDECCEVICGDNNEHRADILTDKEAIEIQYSSIAFEAAYERTVFYNNLKARRTIWIVNAYKSCRDRRIEVKKNNNNEIIVNWKYAKRWAVDISHCGTSDVYLDLSPTSDKLLKIWKHDGVLYGKWIKKHDFFNQHLKEYSDEIDDFNKVFARLNSRDYH